MKPSEKLAANIKAECIRLIPLEMRPKRARRDTWHNQLTIYILRELCPRLPLGRVWEAAIGKTDHSNAIYAVKKAKRAVDSNIALANIVATITSDVLSTFAPIILQLRAATNVNVRLNSIEQVNTIARSIDVGQSLSIRLTDIQTFVKMERATDTPTKTELYRIAAMAILAAEAA